MKKTQNSTIRPPIVVVLGHIDHGKSSLLCAIKDFKITEKESGGITQHIGAYQIEQQGKKITFIDTPGHEAFSAMRSRGAKVADIAVLVVDSSEGVKTQTKEAILDIRKAGIPIIIALNKIDKPAADPERVKKELSQQDILVESIGGKIPSVETSAKTGQGISELLELILLVAEMENLRIDPSKQAEGLVIESYLDKLRGPTATLLLTDGTLKKGALLATFSTFGKVKELENFQGNRIEEIFPADPAIIIGFEKVPKVGEKFKVFSDLENAKKYQKAAEKRTAEVLEISPGQKVLNLILKTDVVGTIEAIETVLKNLPQEKVILRILKAEAGDINESDLKLAKPGKALILGFRVKMNPIAKLLFEREKIKVMSFDVIYDLVEGVRKIMEKRIETEQVRIDVGKVKALIIFLTEKNRQIVGGKVIEGEVKKGTKIEVLRNEEKIGKGKLINLQKDKKDIDQINKGGECGILYEGNVKVEQGDVLKIYTEERKKGEL